MEVKRDAMSEELLRMAEDLEKLAMRSRQEQIQQPLERIKQAADDVGIAWSGSWLGYHASVYYRDLQTPPPGAHFNKGWGLKQPAFDIGSTGDWVEYATEQVKAAIHKRANCASLEPVRTFADEANTEFPKQQRTLLSIIELEMGDSISPFLTGLKEEVGNLTVITENQFVERLMPDYNFTTHDEVAGQQGRRIPPHVAVLSEVYAIQHTINIVGSLAEIARQVESHVSRQQRRQQQGSSVGTRVFIGHGRSPIWMELKIFLEERTGLAVEEYSRVSNAGRPTTDRLREMTETSAAAFLLMTGEDETADGSVRARENVVHEVGLFQGRLGLERAIVLLEEGCTEFSNIVGLGQIRFPKGNISAVFEEIRQFLEREGIIRQ